jgi:hypothetical protein
MCSGGSASGRASPARAATVAPRTETDENRTFSLASASFEKVNINYLAFEQQLFKSVYRSYNTALYKLILIYWIKISSPAKVINIAIRGLLYYNLK